MDSTTVILTVASLGGLYMAWTIGANDVANAMGTSVGSGAPVSLFPCFEALRFDGLRFGQSINQRRATSASSQVATMSGRERRIKWK